MGNIYGGTFKVNALKSAGFRVIADGTIKLNTEIPSSETFRVNDSSPKIELDFKDALKIDTKGEILI